MGMVKAYKRWVVNPKLFIVAGDFGSSEPQKLDEGVWCRLPWLPLPTGIPVKLCKPLHRQDVNAILPRRTSTIFSILVPTKRRIWGWGSRHIALNGLNDIQPERTLLCFLTLPLTARNAVLHLKLQVSPPQSNPKPCQLESWLRSSSWQPNSMGLNGMPWLLLVLIKQSVHGSKPPKFWMEPHWERGCSIRTLDFDPCPQVSVFV